MSWKQVSTSAPARALGARGMAGLMMVGGGIMGSMGTIMGSVGSTVGSMMPLTPYQRQQQQAQQAQHTKHGGTSAGRRGGAVGPGPMGTSQGGASATPLSCRSTRPSLLLGLGTASSGLSPGGSSTCMLPVGGSGGVVAATAAGPGSSRSGVLGSGADAQPLVRQSWSSKDMRVSLPVPAGPGGGGRSPKAGAAAAHHHHHDRAGSQGMSGP